MKKSKSNTAIVIKQEYGSVAFYKAFKQVGYNTDLIYWWLESK